MSATTISLGNTMRCQECGSYSTELVCLIQKDGKVAFKVECIDHGGHSHMILRGRVNLAVEKMLERNK